MHKRGQKGPPWGHGAHVVSLTGLVQRWGKTGEGLGEHRREEVGAVEEEDRDEATAAGHGVNGSGRPYDLETGGDSRGCLRADKTVQWRSCRSESSR